MSTEVFETAEVPAFMPSTPETLVPGSWDKSAQAQLHSESEQLENANCVEEVGRGPPALTHLRTTGLPTPLMQAKPPLCSRASRRSSVSSSWSLLETQNLKPLHHIY